MKLFKKRESVVRYRLGSNIAKIVPAKVPNDEIKNKSIGLHVRTVLQNR